MDSLERLDALVARVEATGMKVNGASVIRAHYDRAVQWRATLVVIYEEGSKEMNGYGLTGVEALLRLDHEVGRFVRSPPQRPQL